MFSEMAFETLEMLEDGTYYEEVHGSPNDQFWSRYAGRAESGFAHSGGEGAGTGGSGE